MKTLLILLFVSVKCIIELPLSMNEINNLLKSQTQLKKKINNHLAYKYVVALIIALHVISRIITSPILDSRSV